MSFWLVLALALPPIAFGAPQVVPVSPDRRVVTVEPACAEWLRPATRGQPIVPPHIAIRYNPRAPGARLASARSLTLVIAGQRGIQFEQVSIPMTRANRIWEVDFTPAGRGIPIPGYWIFFFQDARRIDNNRAQYWDILVCGSWSAVTAQAATYQGRLLAPGVQRPPNLKRAIDILRTALQRDRDVYGYYNALWRYELELAGGSPAAYEQVGKELDALLDAHSNYSYALHQVVDFVASEQEKLPPAVVHRFRDAVIALPKATEFIMHDGTGKTYRTPRENAPIQGFEREATVMLADLDYWSVSREHVDLRKKSDDYIAFAARYADSGSPRIWEAYSSAFQCDKQLDDLAAAESVYEKLAALDPLNPWPAQRMAEFYIARNAKLQRALELLDNATAAYRESERPSSHRHFPEHSGTLEYLRGQAHWMLKELPAARTDLEAAAKAAPDKPDVLYALGQVCEELGDTDHAIKAYLAAAAAPYQQSPAPREAYIRLFLSRNLGTEREADRKLLAQAAGNTRRTAAEYTPVPATRPAPEFSFIDLAGKRFDRNAAKGKPTVLTFWSVWCAPCVAELPAFVEFQKRHAEANLIAVEIGHDNQEIRAFLAAHGLAKLHVARSAEWPQVFGAGAFPTTIVMDRFGQIQFVHTGQLADVVAILGKDLSSLPSDLSSRPRSGLTPNGATMLAHNARRAELPPQVSVGTRKSDTPRGAGGLMSWAVSKTAGPWV